MRKLDVAHLMEDWMELRLSLRDSSRYGHELVIRTYIVPFIGDLLVENLTLRDIQVWLSKLARNELSRRTIEYAWTLLRAAMASAKELGEFIPYIGKVELPPKGNEREVQALSRFEMESLSAAALPHRLGVAVRLALLCGLRRGEILGLRWDDVDYKKKVVRIRRSYVRVYNAQGREEFAVLPPKSRAGKRTIPLPDELADALRFHERQQEAERGTKVQCHGLVIATRAGTHVNPAHMQKWIKKWGLAAGCPDVHWHALRHTYATMLVASGASIKTVAYLLGHSDPAFTIRVYAHINAEMLQEEVEKMMDYIRK